MKTIKKLFEYLVLFLSGGSVYVSIECIYRGYSHPAMFALGGISLILVGLLNEKQKHLNIVVQMLLSGLIITTLELITGLLINENFTIWDYRQMPFNFKGQICLPFSLLWCLLSFIAIKLDDFLRRFL